MKKNTLIAAFVFSIAFANAKSISYIQPNNIKEIQVNTIENQLLNKIPGVKIAVENGVIKVEGAHLEAVYDLTGQDVKNRDLKAGIYIVKISKDKNIAAVKVVVQ